MTPVGRPARSHVDARLVTATNVALDDALVEGRFRRDLYARLAGVIVHTPALRERREDVPLLFRSFLGAAAARPMRRISSRRCSSTLAAQRARAAAARGAPGALLPDAARWERAMLDEEMRAPGGDVRACRGAERGAAARRGTCLREGPALARGAARLLAHFGGNVSKLARLVGRNRKQVYRWMDHHAVDRGTGERDEAREGRIQQRGSRGGIPPF